MLPVPSGSASAMRRPRRDTICSTVSGSSTSAAARALNSPRLWPAAAQGRTLPASSRQRLMLTTVSAGCRARVSLMAASSPSQ